MSRYGTLYSDKTTVQSANTTFYAAVGLAAVAGLALLAGSTSQPSALYTMPQTASTTTVTQGVRVPTYGTAPLPSARYSSNLQAQQYAVEMEQAERQQLYASQGPVATAKSTGFTLLTIGGLIMGAAALFTRFFRPEEKPLGLPPMDLNIGMAATSGAPKKKIVVTGMGICSVFGNDVDKFYDSLLEGKSGIKMIDKFDTERFPTKFAAQIQDFDAEGLIPKKVDRKYDDTIRYSVVSAKKALMQAGLEKAANPEAWEKLEKSKVGVLIGSGMGGLSTLETGVQALNTRGVKAMSPFVIPYSIANMGGSLVAIEQGFMGPNYSIATACASANYAMTASADHIRSGRADVMVTGGSEGSICPVGLGGFVACRALSKNNEEHESASRPWDNTRDGFVMGEGAGVIVLESEEHALARGANIICEYLGGAITTDAHHVTMPREDGLGVASCMKMAMEDAGIEQDQVNYINAHATSTPLGDVAEVNAIKSVFGDMKGMKMNGTKSMIGHCLGAAGGLEALAVIKAIETGKVHPTISIKDPIDEIANIDVCAGGASNLNVTAGMSNSFGFGGHNSVVIFGPYQKS